MLSCMCEAANVFAGPSYDPVAIVGKITDRLKMRMMELRWCGTTRANSGVFTCLIDFIKCLSQIIGH